MPDSNLTPDAALALIRGLSNTENYPFHVEGEERLARVLVEHTAGVIHARLVIEEFDEAETCPTPAALRAAADRLAEVCECGKAKWQHREGSACGRFAGKPEDDGWTKTAAGYAKFRESVPLIDGVPWEVCLQVQSLKIGFLPGDTEKYPEACAAIRAGREPDYQLLQEQMNKLFPWLRIGAAGAKHARMSAGTGDRLKQVATGFARVE